MIRPTVKDAAVIFVDGDGKFKKAAVTEPLSAGAARLELEHKAGSVQASYSAKGEAGSFHYPEQSDAIKAALKGSEQPQPDAAAPAKAAPKPAA